MTFWLLRHLLPIILRVLNTLDRIYLFLFRRRLVRLDKRRLIASLPPDAAKELEDPDVRVPFELNMRAVEEDEKITFFGRYSHYRFIANQLNARARHRRAVETIPSILEVPVTRPLFIIGLPRTGTSLLHNLLTLDGNFRSARLWEMLTTPPVDNVPNWQQDERYLEVAKSLEMHELLSGRSDKKAHLVQAHLPEECHFLLMRSFYIYNTFLCLASMDQLAQWFYSIDKVTMIRFYKFYRQQLQSLGYGHGMQRRHFLLKSHLHLMNLDALLEVFPDAGLIFTHRQLDDVIPSFCSMVESFTAYICPQDGGFGRRSLRLISELSTRAARTLSHLKENAGPTGSRRGSSLLLLGYDDLVAEPRAALDKIYRHFGYTRPSGKDWEAMMTYLSENPQHKHGRHTYKMEDYGITRADVRKSCMEYNQFIRIASDIAH